jgi:hypothetical protein
MKKKFLAGIVVLVTAAFVLAACATPDAPAAPTTDANAVYTQAAATVAAGLTQTAEKNPPPTATIAPPTATPTTIIPTATQGGAVEATQAPTATQEGAAQPTATTAAGVTPVPTATKAGAPAPATGDKGEWVSQTPTDGTQVQKSATFNVTYVIKNTGTTTWTTNYKFRFYAGDQMSAPNDLNLTKEVKPGESAEITFKMIAPDSKKKTNSIWVLSNADGGNFCSVYLALEIVD